MLTQPSLSRRAERGLASLEQAVPPRKRSLTASQPQPAVAPTQPLPNRLYHQQTLYAFAAGLGYGMANALVSFVAPLSQSGGPGNLLVGLNAQSLFTAVVNDARTNRTVDSIPELMGLPPMEQWDACTGQSVLYLESKCLVLFHLFQYW